MLISWKERQCASSVRLRRTYNIHSFLFFQQLHCSEEPSDLCHSPQIPASDRRDGRLHFQAKYLPGYQVAQCEGEVSNVYPKVGELVGLGSVASLYCQFIHTL